MAGKNKIYDILLERNGKTDILKKTLIIIDEAHKLYGGDLKASERPNMEIMEKLINNSDCSPNLHYKNYSPMRQYSRLQPQQIEHYNFITQMMTKNITSLL